MPDWRTVMHVLTVVNLVVTTGLLIYMVRMQMKMARERKGR